MLRKFAVLSALLFPLAAHAQQPDDPRLATYRQLLMEANERVAATAAQVQNLEGKLRDMQKQIDAAKNTPPPAPEASKQ